MMKYVVAKLDIGAIKCDTVGCGWRDDTVHVDDYPAWLNKLCPNCGGNLLTQKDYDGVQIMLRVVAGYNRWCNRLLPAFILRWMVAKAVRNEFDMKGDGKLRRKK